MECYKGKVRWEKAATALDSIDFTGGITICATKECSVKNKCYRYSIYQYLIDNNIMGHTCVLYEHENCTHYIPH
ncbi:hypothetical protein [Pelosinus propionicus]|uniref:Uncharacterized protein n=1 Tax=Pelosinus propionicus DSM 13327 TaxID=1123291 RepID=A0A1I4PTP5_9FIRM|nr:hypothetical protein [Pelosinus propionicus]SFM31124.1 hypothetical protein SAMN04490355_107229 [Pelosinus propionicus DSM 13327]